MEIAVVIILLLFGIALLLVEIFLIPGLSVAGIGGILFLAGSIFYAYSFIGPAAGHLTFVAAVILLGVSIWLFLKTKALERMSLKTNVDGKNDPMQGMNIQVGEEGVAISRLAPMGKIKIKGMVMEAKSVDDFIDEGTEVMVIQVMSTNVLVERKTKK